MSRVIMWSDLHLGHDNAIRWRKKFSTPEEHHEVIYDNLASNVTKRDVLYLLGDICFTAEWLKRIWLIPCLKKVAILGNHDTERGLRGQDFTQYFDEVHGMFCYNRKAWLTHAPIHPQELRGRINIHGHTHDHNITCWSDGYDGNYGDYDVPGEVPDKRYINICPEQTNWKPINYQVLLTRLRDEKVIN